MTQYYFHEKIVLALCLLILNNYLFLNFNFPILLIKINFLIFLLILLIFYFKNFSENLFLKIFFMILIFISLGTPTFEWDPRSIWLFHAKRIFYENSIFAVADNYAEFSHNGYPKIASAFASSFAVLIGHWNEVFPKLSFLFMFLPPLILTYIFFKETQYLIFLSIVFFTVGKFLFNGWSDGLIAVYFCLSAFLMYLLMISDNDYFKKKFIYYLIAFCFFIILTLIKNEGSVLLLILFTTVFLTKFFKKEFGKDIYRLIFLSFSFLPIIFWKLFCYLNGIGYSEYYNLDILSNLLPRLYELNNYQLISYFLLLNEKFLVCLIFFLISFWLNWDKKVFNYVSISALIYIFVLSFVFLSTPYDLFWQLDSSAARIVRSLSFLLAFFGLYNLRNKISD